MSKDKAPRKYYANWMSLESTLELAKDCTPRAEWCDIQCFVEEQAYDALEAKLALAISLASHKFDCTIMTNGQHECNCGYNKLKVKE